MSILDAERKVRECEERVYNNFQELAGLHALALYSTLDKSFPADMKKVLSQLDSNRYQEARDHSDLREARKQLHDFERERREELLTVVEDTNMRSTARLEAALRLIDLLGLTGVKP